MPKPDFSGTWTFNRAKSALQIQAPDASVFVVEHRDPEFRLTRTHVAGDRHDTFSLDLTTDGRETVVDRGDVRLHSRARWDGDALIFDTRLSKGGEDASNVVRYTLSADGGTIVADERFRSALLNYDNVWVLDRDPAERRNAQPAPATSSGGACAWCGAQVGEDAFMLRVGALLCARCAELAARIAADQRQGKDDPRPPRE